MNEAEILLDKDQGIWTITLNRPSHMNSFNKTALQSLAEYLRLAKESTDCSVVVITGQGPKAFSSGADVHTFLEEKKQALGIDWSKLGQNVFAMLDEIGKPSIAAINGIAFGGAFELALACTFRIASEEARFSFPEINLGFIPGWGGTQRATRLLGPAVALELILTGSVIDASRALALGIVSQVVPGDRLMETAREFALKMVGKPPLAIRFALEAVHAGLDVPLKEGLKLEGGLAAMAVLSEDGQEGIKAFFEKRKPVFRGC